MKIITIVASAAVSVLPAGASITIASTGSSGATQAYATTHFTAVNVNVGDILVVVHAPNKRTTSNTITATFSTGANTFTAVNSGDSGGQAAAWIFHSTITEAGSFNIALDTSNTTKTASHATSYYVLRSNVSGATLSVADTDGNAGAGITSLNLSGLSWSESYGDCIALAGAAIQTGTITSPGGDWVESLDRGPDKRINCTNQGIISPPLSSFTITSGAADNLAAAGIVIGESVTEPIAPPNDGTWTFPGDGTWNGTNVGLWANSQIASGAGHTAAFNAIDLTADITVTVGEGAGGQTIGSMNFGDTDTASPGGWIISSTASPIILEGATPTIAVGSLATGKDVTIQVPLAGTSGFAKSGSGTLTLTNQSTLTGTVTANEGVLNANGPNSANGALGKSSIVIGGSGQINVGGDNSLVGTATSAARSIRLNAGGTLHNPGGSTNRLHAVVMNGGTISAAIENSVSGNWNFSHGVSTPGTDSSTSSISGGNAALAQTGGTVFNIATGDTLTVTCHLQTIGTTADTGLIKTGGGLLVLGGSNTYQSTTTVNAGTLKLATGGSISGTSAITVASGAEFDVSEAGFSLDAGQTLTAGNQSPDSDVVGALASAGTIRPGGDGTIGTITGITHLTLGGTLNLDLDLSSNTCDGFAIGGFLAISPGFAVGFAPVGTTTSPSPHFTVVSGITAIMGTENLPAVAGFRWDHTTAPGELRLVRTVSNLVWQAFSDSIWNTTSLNWNGDGSVVAYSEADNTTFDDTASGQGEVIVELPGDVSPGQVVVSNETRDYTFTEDPGATEPTGIIGSASLTKTGDGMLTLLTDNRYTGGTTIAGGTLAFETGGLAASGPISMSGGSLCWQGANTQDLSSRLVLVSGKPATFDTNGNSVTFASAIGGGTTASLIKLGEGTLTLSSISTNTYSGATTIRGGVLAFSSGALGTSGAITMDGGAVRWYGVTNSRDLSSRLVMIAGKAATFDTNGNSVTFASAFGGGVSAPLVKQGAGILTLSAANTFTGGVSVENGSLELTNAAAAGPATNTITMSALDTVGAITDLRFSGSASLTIAYPLVISDVGQVKRLRKFGTGTTVYAGNITVNETTEGLFEIQVGSGNTLTITGDISDTGTGGIEKINAGTLILQGAKSYTGTTTVSSGTLILDTPYLADSSTVKIATQCILNLTHASTDTVDKLFVNGVQKPAGIYKAVGAAGEGTELAELGTSTGKLQVTTSPVAAYDTWKTKITNGLDARDQDADADGFTNLQEFIFGTDPMAGNPTLSTAETSGSNLVIRWQQLTAGASYALRQSSALNNDWTAATGATINDDGTAADGYQPKIATIPIGAGNRFYRVEGTEN